MAYQFGSACYDTAAQAVQAMAAAHVPVTESDMAITVASVTDSAITFLYTPVGSGVPPFTVSQAVALLPCNLLTQADALNVGWMIGGAWLSVYAVTFLIRLLRGEMETPNASDT